MLDVKTWLKTTGMEVADTCFLKPPSLPYILFLEDRDVGGADNKNCIANTSIKVELYSDKINSMAEQQIENLLNEKAIEYKKERIWIKDDNFFETVYDFNLIEKF